MAQGAPADADNAHRFLAGVYIGWAPLFAWAAATIRRQGVLVYFLAVPIFLSGVGKLVSFARDGMSSPAGVFLASALLELILPDRHRLGALHRTQIQTSGGPCLRHRTRAGSVTCGSVELPGRWTR